MKQEIDGSEDSEVQKGEGEKPLCPHCNQPMQISQPQYLSNYWQWNDETKIYERDEPDPRTEEPFCAACRAEYRDSLYK